MLMMVKMSVSSLGANVDFLSKYKRLLTEEIVVLKFVLCCIQQKTMVLDLSELERNILTNLLSGHSAETIIYSH